MKTKLTFLIAGFIGLASVIHAQSPFMGSSKVMVESGDISALKDEKLFNLKFEYDGMAVGKFKTEAEYTRTKVQEYNAKEKGKGDAWLNGWRNARQEKYEPKFSELINDVMKKKEVKYENSPSAKYTLIVKTTFTEPGYNIGIAKYPAFANFDFIFVETANPSNVVAKLYVQNVIGQQAMGFDYDVSSRVCESYAKGGKMLGKFLLKNMD